MLGEFWPQASLKLLLHLNGNSNDDSGFSHNGTDTAITYSQANGRLGQGAGFNGSTSKIAITDHSDLKPTGSFSIGCLVKTTSAGAFKNLFQSFNVEGDVYGGFELMITSANVARFTSYKNTGQTNNTDFKEATGTKTITDGVWHLVVGVWDGTNLLIYVDGNLEATASWANAPAYRATNIVYVGWRNTTQYSDGQKMNGQIDELFLFNGVALTAQQIRRRFAWIMGKLQ